MRAGPDVFVGELDLDIRIIARFLPGIARAGETGTAASSKQSAAQNLGDAPLVEPYKAGPQHGRVGGEGALKGKRVEHTFTKHGSHNTSNLLRQARGSGEPVGQWVDDTAAEQFIADRLSQLKNGTKTFDLPGGLGRVINPDGSFTPATRATLVPSGSGVKTAFPTR